MVKINLFIWITEELISLDVNRYIIILNIVGYIYNNFAVLQNLINT
jgi:hypothetical protein